MERVTIEVLDSVAPLRAIHHKFASAWQLSPEAVAAKRDQRSMIVSGCGPKGKWTDLATAMHVAKPTFKSATRGTNFSSEKLKTVPVTRRGSGRPSKTSSILQHVSQQVRQMRTNQEPPAVHPSSVIRSSTSGQLSARNSKVSYQIRYGTTNRSADKSSSTCHLLQKVRYRNFCRRCPASRSLVISFWHPHSSSVPKLSPHSSSGWQTSPVWKVLSLPASRRHMWRHFLRRSDRT